LPIHRGVPPALLSAERNATAQDGCQVGAEIFIILSMFEYPAIVRIYIFHKYPTTTTSDRGTEGETPFRSYSLISKIKIS
jgi:hypothetical protein